MQKVVFSAFWDFWGEGALTYGKVFLVLENMIECCVEHFEFTEWQLIKNIAT